MTKFLYLTSYNKIKEVINIKKRFKTSKRKMFCLRIILFIITLGISLYGGFKIINTIFDSKISEEIIINYILGDYDYNLSNFLKFKDKNFFLDYTFVLNKENEAQSEDEVDLTTGEYMEDPKKEEISLPIVYLYNTHQTEEYGKDYLEPYSIKPTVMLTSYMLREQLNDLGIPTIVETNEVKKVLNEKNWKYGKSYLVSRIFLEEAKNKNPSLKLFIDLHRDSGSHKATTIQCEGKNFARFLFVVGLEHEKYDNNLNNAMTLDNKIETKCQKLSRGIMKKSGKGVNGIYNQDFDENVFLIEVGGQYNNIEEVKNSVKLLADVIFDYVKETYET